jgi:hypothetical protein
MPSRLVKIWLAASQKKNVRGTKSFSRQILVGKTKVLFMWSPNSVRGKLEQLIYTYYITIN